VTFAEVDGEPAQSIHQQVNVPWQFHDFSDLQGATQQERVRQLVAAQLDAPLKNNAPMIRVQLVRLHAKAHCVIMQLPHIVSDVWTEHILIEDLAEIYSARSIPRKPSLPELPVRYVDYADWFQRKLVSSAMQEQKDYWLEKFGDVAPPLDLKRASSRADGAQTEQDRVLDLPKELMVKLKQLASDQGTTLFVALLATFQTLLARLTGSTDIAVGTAVSGRTHPDLERVAGFFMNPLCLRSDLSGNPIFSELLGRVRQTVLSALAHQEYPFQQWLHALRRKQERSGFFPYSVVLLVEEKPKTLFFAGAKAYFDALPGHGLDLHRVAGPKLSVRLSEGPDNWCAEVIPGTLDTAPAPAGLLQRWAQLLQGIVENPAERISEFNLIESCEQKTLSCFSSGVQIDDQLLALAGHFQRLEGCGVVALASDGRIICASQEDSGDALFRLLCGQPIKALAASSEGLQRLVETGSLQELAPDLKQVIVRAPSQLDVAHIHGKLGIKVSAFVALDESSDALLWIDRFNAEDALAGHPVGEASIFVLDEWGKTVPIGVRGKLHKQKNGSGEMFPLSWFGRWQSDGTLAIEGRCFETLELEAEELEELLR
jgi:hypothetical protein